MKKIIRALLVRYEEVVVRLFEADQIIERVQDSHRRLRAELDESEQARRAGIETAANLRDLVIQCKARLGLPHNCEPLPPVDRANAQLNDYAERLEASRQVAEERQETILAVRRELADVNRSRDELRRERDTARAERDTAQHNARERSAELAVAEDVIAGLREERDEQRELLGQRDRQMTELVQERSALVVERDAASKEAERWKKLAYADPDVRAQELKDVRAERDKLERDRDEWKERCQSEWRKHELLDPVLLDGWAPAVYRADTNGHWRWACSLDDPSPPQHDTRGPVLPGGKPGQVHRLEQNVPGLYSWDEDASEWRPTPLPVGSGSQDAGPVLPKERTANGYFELTEEKS